MEYGLTLEERNELMAVGAAIADEIVALVKSASPNITMNAVHNAMLVVNEDGGQFRCSKEIIVLFTVTDLRGSSPRDLEAFIEKRLMEWIAKPEMTKYKIKWHVAMPQGGLSNDGNGSRG